MVLPRISLHMGMEHVRGTPLSEADFHRILARHTVEDWLHTQTCMNTEWPRAESNLRAQIRSSAEPR